MKKIAVVTGARRGIGFGIAKRLLEDGYYVILSARSNTLDTNEELLSAYKGSYEYIACDVSSAKDRDNLIDSVVKKHKRLDVLVNNAGVAPKERLDILSTTEESYEYVMNTNAKSTFFMCQKAANQMIALKEKLDDYNPRIINISSLSAYTASINRGEYCISKAAISMTTQLFATKLAEFRIPVFEVRPGIIQTDMTEGVKDKYNKMISEGLIPFNKFGKPEDVAACVSSCVSGNLDFSTGQVINADGGFHLRRL